MTIKGSNGTNKLLAILIGLIVTMAGGGVSWLRSDISALNSDIVLLRDDVIDLKIPINGNNITEAELVKDVNMNMADIAKNTYDIEELKR